MKQKQKNNISLKKLTIARINTNGMRKINGGTSIPTSGDPDYFYCIMEH
ncbi:hypothetical protein ACWGOQ_0000515 [Aquimarina sp. M1]